VFGQKVKCFKVHTAVSLENLVPPDNFYRELETKLDLTFVRDLVRDHYSSGMGRPSIDPVVFFKLQLIMFFEGIRSERQLMAMVNMRLDLRWYIGYDLDEAVPDHSSLSKIRERYGLEVFQCFFEQIVERCIQAGLVWGKELFFDGTKVRANADIDSLMPRFYVEAKQHLNTLFTKVPSSTTSSSEVAESSELPASPRGFVAKYKGDRIADQTQATSYRRMADDKASLTDPDATPMQTGEAGLARLGYHTHYVVDGGKARIILAVLVTPASVMDNTPMLDLARWVRFRWRVRPRIAVGDAKYGTIYNIVGLEQDGIRAYMPPHNQERQQHGHIYPKSHFQYEAERDCYICPQGQSLPFRHPSRGPQINIYRAEKQTCDACLVQEQCRTGNLGRSISRSFFEDYLARVEAYQQTEDYQKAMRKRQVWPEPLFGEAKQWHQMSKFRLRRLEKVHIEAFLIAAGQNIKRLLRPRRGRSPLKPAAAQALDVLVSVADVLLPATWKWIIWSGFSLDPISRRAGPKTGGQWLRLFQQAARSA
jgi:transposase